jgi:zinc protease
MNVMRKILILIFISLSGFAQSEFKIDYESFTLPNGLQVIFHVDRSDPVVSVNITAHVGSAREKEGRTGFAHLFEHLLFLESENLGKGGLDKLSARIGGSGANGSTSRDRTNYLQTVPKDALEKMLWAEADKLGWFINTVTDQVLAKEKQVVKNEKRQGVDNAPYGHTQYVIDQALYPKGHPYSWQVIGSLEDLDRATLDDVKEFFRRWYVPNNVTLVVAGDFDPKQAKSWVHKYFDEIKRGEDIPRLNKQPGVVNEIIKLYHEDNFARLPELTYVWPTVEEYNPDSYALEILSDYLTTGKKAPFYKVLVEEEKLTSNVNSYKYTSEIAGQVGISVRAFASKDLDEVAKAIQLGFERFEKEGISEKDLSRIKAGLERQFYNSLSSVLGKGASLAHYNIFAGDAGFAEKEIKNILKVSTADIMRVYEKYIKGKNYVATSFVPKGAVQLALEGSIKADVVEEPIVEGAEESFDATQESTYTKTPSRFDRTQEPPYGSAPEVKIPKVWEQVLTNGAKVYGIENSEVPLIQMTITIDGGQLLEEKSGVSNLTARLLSQGTKSKTPTELEEAIKQLGSDIRIFATKESIVINVSALARNYQATMKLVEEILLEPRWDSKEFELIKTSVISQIRQQEANPNSVATAQFNQLLYGEGNKYSQNLLGTSLAVQGSTIDDLKVFYQKNISPSVARIHVVGAMDKANVMKPLQALSLKWSAKAVLLPQFKNPVIARPSTLFFYDIPDSKQSLLRIGNISLKATDKDFYPATIANYILGGGSFASQLTQELRETKGYTYGVSSSFSGSRNTGTFEIGTGVRSNVTLESLESILNILKNYGQGFSQQDLETTKGFLIKSQARAFETASAKLGMLDNISKYGWKSDYVKDRAQIVNGMTVPKIQKLVVEYINPEKMIWLVVGDAKTQLSRLKDLGLGEPVLINPKP